jgi:methyl-accepting chemotaxis protein
MSFTRTTGILMPQLQNNSDSKFLYGLLPTLPVILGGVIVTWQDGVTLYNVLFSLMLAVCGSGSGLFLWHRHANELAQTNFRRAQDESSKIDAVSTYTAELERLLLTISPIISQQVMVSREHTEQEIISLSSRFSGMVNELRQIVESTDNALGGQQSYHLDSVINTSRNLLQPVLDLLRQIHQLEQKVVDDTTLSQAEANINQTLSLLSLALTHYHNDVEALRNNAEQIRGEINNVLVALQFQDRVSQILTQVENNLLNLQKTIEKIQQQGSNRDSDMLKVDEAVEHIEENYKSVSSPVNRGADNLDDLTFF